MVHAVIRRGCEDVFNHRMKFANIFRVHPELEQYRDLVGDKNDHRMEAKKRDRKKKNDFDVLYPAETERYGEVVILSGVMRHVSRPPEALTMGDIVGPVTAQIEKDVAGNEGPPVQFHPPWDLVIDPDEYGKYQKFKGCANSHIAYTDPDGTECFFLLVVVPVLQIRDEVLN